LLLLLPLSLWSPVVVTIPLRRRRLAETADSATPKQGSTQSPESDASADSAAGVTGRTLTEAELEKLIVAKGDVKGFEAAKPARSDVSAGGSVKASRAACQPIAELVQNAAAGTPSASAYRQLITSDEEGMTAAGVLVGLSSYEKGQAKAALAAIRDAVKTCGGGFTTTASGDSSSYAKVTEEQGPSGVAESVAFELNGALDGDEVPLKYALARRGSTVALFYSMDPFEPEKAEIAPEVIAAQLNKLK
jgi:hypothetical protein